MFVPGWMEGDVSTGIARCLLGSVLASLEASLSRFGLLLAKALGRPRELFDSLGDDAV